MPTRFSASVGYASGDVRVEVDVSVVSDKEYDPGTGRWRDANGRFTSPPSVQTQEVERRAEEVQQVAARNMRSRELSQAIRNAELSVEDGETVGERARGEQSVVRIDPDGSGEWVRYRVRGRRLERL